MDRITEKHLDGAVNRLNLLHGMDKPKWGTVGMFVLDGAYGGWKLARLVSAGGGQDDISSGGFVSKRELWNQIQAMISLHYSMQKQTV